ncbi:phage holin family protein [Stieleria sp. JC731]|uniref:phage holin family protein n=1 Tax=Pirellulaceae TaxID=2691357 RepID=UPI001E3247DF|nr:phage holin family protein [Stieleria sp. JC731]MCC9601748.1 phage holin family protein [Stieleria sp. JC731]
MSDEKQTSPMRAVIRDVIDLMELQWQLLSVDSQAARRKLTVAMVAGTAAVTLAGSALTVLLVGLGFLLRDLTALTAGASIVVVSVLAFITVGALLWYAAKAMVKASEAMNESKSEFVESLKWLKATLVSPSHSARNQIRAEDFDRPGERVYPNRHREPLRREYTSLR